MYDFLLQFLFFGSLTAIVYMSARALPRVSEDEVNISILEYLEKCIKKIPLAKIDQSLNIQTKKFLRKIRVLVLRLDNVIHNYLKDKNNGSETQSDLDLFNQLKKDK